MTKRQDEALKIRDAALVKVQAEGTFEEVKGASPALGWSGEGLHIMYRTPFQKLPGPPSKTLIKSLSMGMIIDENLEYGLDIWEKPGLGKVLNIEWSDQGEVHLAGFRRGEWEKKVLDWIKK